MTCQTCGRPAENGRPTHWLGCANAPRPYTLQDEARALAAAVVEPLLCEQGGCLKAKREGSGKGAKPKYCDDHSDPKNRK